MAQKKKAAKKTPKATPKQKEIVEDVMHEFKEGELHSGSEDGPIVEDRDQAIAIALNEAGLSNQQKSKKSSSKKPSGKKPSSKKKASSSSGRSGGKRS